MKIKLLAFISLILLFNNNFVYGVHGETVFEPLMPGYAVYSTIIENTNLYKEHRKVSKVIGSLEVGTRVEILKDYSAKWYYIHDEDRGLTGWVESKVLLIPPDESSEKKQLINIELEDYVNSLELASDTAFLIYTDLWRQHVHVFTGTTSDWLLLRTFVCSTGKNESPTTRGQFKISERGSWFYSKRLGSGGKFWVRFNDTYLFHSVAMNQAKEVIDPTLGERSSSGCVRLSVEDAEWIYVNIPEGTTVIIN